MLEEKADEVAIMSRPQQIRETPTRKDVIGAKLHVLVVMRGDIVTWCNVAREDQSNSVLPEPPQRFTWTVLRIACY